MTVIDDCNDDCNDDFNYSSDCYDDHHSGSLRSEDEETSDDYVSEMCGILALFGADPQANSELRAELLR